MKNKTVYVYSDSGHAWAKVLRKDLLKLGVLGQISSFSYQRDEYVYLEEDKDLSIYVNALKNKGLNPKFKEFNSQKSSKIRSYQKYFYADLSI